MNNSVYTFEDLWKKEILKKIKIDFLEVASQITQFNKNTFKEILNESLMEYSQNYFKMQNKFKLKFKKLLHVEKRERIKTFCKFLIFSYNSTDFPNDLKIKNIDFNLSEFKNINELIICFNRKS